MAKIVIKRKLQHIRRNGDKSVNLLTSTNIADLTVTMMPNMQAQKF